MGCCVLDNRSTSKKIDILLNSEELIKNDECQNVNEEMTNFQIKQKTGKEYIKKEKSAFEPNNNINSQEIKKVNNNKNKEQPKISGFSKTQISGQNRSSCSKEKENSLKVNKKRVIKKGSENIYCAMRKLKLLSIEELDNKKTFFP